MSAAVTRIEYRGPAPLVGALAQMLREAGAEADYEAPEEKRGAGEIVHEVVVYLACRGAESAIEAALAKFRASRFGPHTEVTLFSSEDKSDE